MLLVVVAYTTHGGPAGKAFPSPGPQTIPPEMQATKPPTTNLPPKLPDSLIRYLLPKSDHRTSTCSGSAEEPTGRSNQPWAKTNPQRASSQKEKKRVLHLFFKSDSFLGIFWLVLSFAKKKWR